jgi:hypothetical protein
LAPLADVHQARSIEARLLSFTRGKNSRAHSGAGFTCPIGGEFFVVHARHVQVNIKAIVWRTGDALLMARDQLNAQKESNPFHIKIH